MLHFRCRRRGSPAVGEAELIVVAAVVLGADIGHTMLLLRRWGNRALDAEYWYVLWVTLA